MPRTLTRRAPAGEGAVVSKAALRAAAALGLSHKVLSRVVGLSEASISRLSSGLYTLAPGDKPYELAVLFVRLFRALDAVTGGDGDLAHAWLRRPNAALGEVPLTLIQTVPGLVHVVGYLDARRALV